MTFYHQFNERRDETISRLADSMRRGEYRGLVTLKECKVCGNIEWVSTSVEGYGHVIEPRESFDGTCGLCRRSRSEHRKSTGGCCKLCHSMRHAPNILIR